MALPSSSADSGAPPATARAGVLGRVRALLTAARTDSLVRNSLFLMLTTVTMAAAGFGFWVVNARLYSPEAVGEATTLISAVNLLSQLSLVGMNTMVVRHFAGAPDRGRLVSAAGLTVAVASTLLSALYLVLLPLTAPLLVDTMWQPAVAVSFVLLSVGSAVNLFTDSVFIAGRSAIWNLTLDGLLLGALKLLLPFALVGLGMVGIYSSAGLASTVTSAVSLAVLHWVIRLRLRPSLDLALLRETMSYSAANYVANAFNLLPVLVMPLVLLSRAGPVVTAGFFIAFQIALIFNSVAYAASEAMFAEVSHDVRGLRATALRALALILALLTPAVLVTIAAGGWVLSFFGEAYQETAYTPLIVFSLGAFAVAIYSWGTALLKISGDLVGIVVVNVLYAGVIISLTLVWADRGSSWVAVAWGLGNLVAGLLAIVLFLYRRGRAR